MQLADAQGNPAVRSAGDIAGARRSLERAGELEARRALLPSSTPQLGSARELRRLLDR